MMYTNNVDTHVVCFVQSAIANKTTHNSMRHVNAITE